MSKKLTTRARFTIQWTVSAVVGTRNKAPAVNSSHILYLAYYISNLYESVFLKK